MKPATEARLAAVAKGFTDVHFRGPNSIAMRNPTTGKVSLDVGIGQGWHYGDGLEADSAWLPDEGAWQYKIEALNGFRLNARNILNAGNLVQWSDVASGQYIVFQPLALNWVDNSNDSRQQITQPQAVSAQVEDDVLYFPNGYGTGRHFRYVAGIDRLTKQFIIDSIDNLPAVESWITNPYLEVEFIITPSSGVTLFADGVAWGKKTKTNPANSIAFKLATGETVWTFSAPKAYDSAGEETGGIFQLRKQGGTLYCTVRFSKEWIDSAIFPIVFDPTVEYQVGAGADDGFWVDTPIFNNDASILYFGRHYSYGPYRTFCRWSGVTVPDGATINDAYLSFYFNAYSGTIPSCDIYFYDEANPATVADAATGASRAKTTAYVATTPPTSGTWWNTASIVSIIQELIASYSYAAGAAMMCYITTTYPAGTNRQESFSLEGTYAPKLHIEYTESSGGIIHPIISDNGLGGRICT